MLSRVLAKMANRHNQEGENDVSALSRDEDADEDSRALISNYGNLVTREDEGSDSAPSHSDSEQVSLPDSSI